MPDAGDPHSLPADTVMTLAFDARGVLWIGTTAGIARWNGHGFERIALPGNATASIVFSLTVEGDALWAGTSVGVFRRGPDGRWVSPSWSPMFERPNAMTAIARDRDGQFWIGSQRGLWRTRADGIPAPLQGSGPGIAKAVTSLLLQADGALWAPVPGAGLGYLRSDWRATTASVSASGATSRGMSKGCRATTCRHCMSMRRIASGWRPKAAA
jgi:ligand-binding sensor domain-containing protein